MSGGNASTVELIDAVDAFARTLYMRAKASSASFADAALAVRQLHLSLRHLRTEAADADSLLNSAEASVYARQLRPLVEDCDFALQQLETIINKYGDGNGPGASDEQGPGPDRIAAARNKLANEKINVDMFLDTVQLHNPATKPAAVVDPAVESSSTGLEDIKDKLDAVAKKVFSRRDTGFQDGEHILWQEFKTELEKEGFSPEVLRKHKDVLRAYIREMEAMSCLNGGSPPTVRGLLEYEANSTPSKDMFSAVDNEKCLLSIKSERPMPDHAPLPPRPTQPAYEHHSNSSQDSGSHASDSLALISTRDLVAMDSLHAGMAGMHLTAPNSGYTHSPVVGSPKYLASHMDRNQPVPSDISLSSSPVNHHFGTSPRNMPPLPPYAASGQPPPPYASAPRSAARLAPDRYGNEIPMDAPWTKIKRSLVSIEVLDRAGVRYEARPDYVAVLGRLSREQIADYARQSADCRAARSQRGAHARPSEKFRHREDSKSSRDDDDEDSVLWDESDTTDTDDDKTSDKGTKSYPYIVSPPDKKDSSASTVPPKPILKKRPDTHVRFDPQPHDLESKSPRSIKDRDDRDRRSHRHREHREHRDRDRDGSGRHRDSDRRSADRDRRSSERHRGYDDEHRRDRDRDRDHHRRSDKEKEDRNIRKKAWGETIVAGGIGGAAVSLLSVLAEAASSI
jgi:hypothetical protein